MSTEDGDDLAFEAATNRAYLAALKRRLARRVELGLAANEKWLGNIPRPGWSSSDLGTLVARVGLDFDDEDLGTAFYIGARWLPDWDYSVVCWDAPVARVFYQPEDCSHELVGHVIVRRTLLERHHDIVKIDDEWATQSVEPSPFAARILDIPAAPQPARRVATSSGHQSEREIPVEPIPAKPENRPELPSRNPIDSGGGVRALKAVQYALRVPRATALSSVLSTLQPDQYALVSQASQESVMIQGHPGTGKTIIGVHRAAYLVSDERPARERVTRLLLVGPTEEWVRHVSGIVRTLDPEQRVTVKALPTWLSELAGFDYPLAGHLDGSVEDVGRFVKGISDQAAQICLGETNWETGPRARLRNLKRLYETMRAGGSDDAHMRLGKYSTDWINTLPPFAEAVSRRRYLPLFAQAALSIQGRAPATYGHVVVDEAQDVSGLEWEIIRAHNSSGTWTLLGDMNQRRTDFGDATWQGLAGRLELRSVSDPHVISRGYRSTQAILDFAKPLLPKGQRTARSLQQEGPRPVVTRATRQADRGPLALREAARLLEAYTPGTVAVITTMPDEMSSVVLKEGWRRADQEGDWMLDGRRLSIRTPETARGVEFDGVVVVEPAAFPENLGRQGPLYTSLTRANRELAVVYHMPLPDALRHHARD